MWDDAATTVIADNERKVVIPGAKPGDVFDCQDEGNGHFVLARVNQPELRPRKMTRAEIREAIANSKLRMDMSWEELRQLTREP